MILLPHLFVVGWKPHPIPTIDRFCFNASDCMLSFLGFSIHDRIAWPTIHRHCLHPVCIVIVV